MHQSMHLFLYLNCHTSSYKPHDWTHYVFEICEETGWHINFVVSKLTIIVYHVW